MSSFILVIAILLIVVSIFYLVISKDKNDTDNSDKKTSSIKIFTEEEKQTTQEDFYKFEKWCKSLVEIDSPDIDIDCMVDMIRTKELKLKSGKIVTPDIMRNLLRFQKITKKCWEEEYDPKNNNDREIAETLIDLEDDDDDDEDSSVSVSDDSYDEPRTSSPTTRQKQTSLFESPYSVYQAQVRGGTTWLNIGGTRNEDGAIRSVDYEKSRNPEKRYRVVEIKNGKIIGTVYSC